MPLTGLANAAIDRIAPEPHAFVAGLATYAEADLACYRSDWPPELVSRQAQSWDELLAWGRRRYDVDFATTSGLLHVPQPQATVDRLAQAVAELDAFHLAGLSPLVTAGGSLLAALAVLEKALTPEEAWDAVSVDERWQLEQWGADGEAEAALENRRQDFLAAARFLDFWRIAPPHFSRTIWSVRRADEVADEGDEADSAGALRGARRRRSRGPGSGTCPCRG